MNASLIGFPDMTTQVGVVYTSVSSKTPKIMLIMPQYKISQELKCRLLYENNNDCESNL